MDVQQFFLTYLLLPIMVFIGGFFLSMQNAGRKFCTNKRLLFSLLLVGTLLGLPGVLGYLRLDYMPWGYFMSMLYNLCMGMIFIYTLTRRYAYEFNANKFFVVLFMVIAAVLGGYIHMQIFRLLYDSKLAPWAATSTGCCILPLFFYWSYMALMNIPAEIYKVWQMPPHAAQPELEGLDFDRMLVLDMEVFRSPMDSRSVRVKVKAPADMIFGDWFHKFIEDYNLKFPQTPIIYRDLEQKSYYWIFFIRKSVFRRNEFIDPDLSIQQNRLTEKLTLHAKRVSVSDLNPRTVGEDAVFI